MQFKEQSRPNPYALIHVSNRSMYTTTVSDSICCLKYICMVSHLQIVVTEVIFLPFLIFKISENKWITSGSFQYKTCKLTIKLQCNTSLHGFTSYFMMLSVFKLYGVWYKFSIKKPTVLILIYATNFKSKNKQKSISVTKTNI